MITLASQSPRRKRIFELLQCPFQIILPKDVKEEKDNTIPAEEMVMQNAMKKAFSCCADVKEGIIIGADTEVIMDGHIFGKPRDKADAFDMLKTLSGRTHKVITGVALHDITWHKEVLKFFDISLVTFKKLDVNAIHAYMEKTHVLDKAGAYAVQDSPDTIISSVSGSLWNVIGFPVEKFDNMIRDKKYYDLFHFALAYEKRSIFQKKM